MNLNSKKFDSIVPRRPVAIAVVGGDLSTALKIWKRSEKVSDIYNLCQEKTCFISTSVKRRKQRDAAKFIEQQNARRNKATR
jgi:ribosomal protein S21